MAHAWDSNAGATEWTFYLRKGVRFHHGRELTSEDVRFTLERLNGDKLHSWMVRSVIRTEVCEIENYHQQGNYLRECLHPEMLGWAEQQINLGLAAERADERRQLLNAIEKRLYDEGHVLFLLHKKINTYIHPNVKGVGLNSLGWMDFKDIWLEPRVPGT